MGGANAMKGMKTMKKKKPSKIARGVLAKSQVLKGRKAKTAGGLTKDGLMVNKRGKVVSKKQSTGARRRYGNSALKKWVESVQQARKALGITGFVVINGKTAQGKALYAKAKGIYQNHA